MNAAHMPLRRLTASVAIFSLLMSSTYSVQASLKTEMDGLYDQMKALPGDLQDGFKSLPDEITKGTIIADGPSAIRGQSYGTYMGGSIQARYPIRNLQLANIEMPHFSAGCGGIDMTFGSISILSNPKLIQFLQSVAMNATGVLVELAINAITPLLGSQLAKAKDLVDRINNFNKNSCEIAQKGVKGAMDISGIASECIDNNMIYKGMDAQEASDGCQKADDVKAALDSGKAVGTKRFFGNMVWEMLKMTNLGDTDDTVEEREMIMSMMGTMVYPEDTTLDPNAANNPDAKVLEKTSIHHAPFPYPATLTDLNDFLYGNGDAQTDPKKIGVKMYRCKNADGTADHACLKPIEETVPVDSFRMKVSTMMQGIATKIRTHERLSKADMHFIAETSEPVKAMMDLGTEVNGSWLAEDLISAFKDVIAAAYAKGMLDRNVDSGIKALKQQIILTEDQNSYLGGLINDAFRRQDLFESQLMKIKQNVSYSESHLNYLVTLGRMMLSNTNQEVQDLIRGVDDPGTGSPIG